MAKKEFNLEVEANRHRNNYGTKYIEIIEELLKDPNRDYSSYYRKNLSQMEVMDYLFGNKLYSNGYIANIETRDIEEDIAKYKKKNSKNNPSGRTIQRCIKNLVEYGYLNKYDEVSYKKDREDNYQSRRVVYHLVATTKLYQKLEELDYHNTNRPSDADIEVLNDFYSNLVKTSVSTIETKTVERDFIKTTTYQNGKKSITEKEIY